MHTHYQVLGIDRDASQEDVRAAFRRRALETHPDKTGGADAEFRAVSEAYNVLRDPTSRRIYDACMDAGSSDLVRCLVDLLARCVNDWRARGDGAPTPPATMTLSVRIEATLKEVYDRAVKCVRVRVHGVPGTDHVTLYVPLAGAQRRHVFKGLGDAAPDGTRGDIHVDVDMMFPEHVRQDDVIDPLDLHVDHALSLYEYLFADQVMITLDPDMEPVPVPYMCGQRIACIDGAGLPGTGHGVRGTLLVHFTLEPPTLSTERREALRVAYDASASSSGGSSGSATSYASSVDSGSPEGSADAAAAVAPYDGSRSDHE